MRTANSSLSIPKILKPVAHTPSSLNEKYFSPLPSPSTLSPVHLAQNAKKRRKNPGRALSRGNSSTSVFSQLPQNFVAQQSYGNFSALSKLVQETDNKNKKTVTITILSNYGHPSEISCAAIDFLTVNSHKAEVVDMFLDGSRKKSETLQNLFNDNSTPSSENNCWVESWPPEFPRSTYTMKFTLTCDDDIGYCRIWPNTIDPSKNIKAAVISINDKIIFHGDFPYDMVHSFTLYESAPIVDVCSSPILHEIADDFARAHSKNQNIVFSPENIRFIPTSSYCGDAVFGLNQILLFDDMGKLISVDNKDVFLTSKSNSKEKETNDLQLFRPITSGNQTFLVESDICITGPIQQQSFIEITFRKRFNIGCIMLMNPNMSKDLRLTSTKTMCIYFDKKKIWVGRIRRRLADTMDEVKCGAFVWLIEDKQYQNKVLSQFPKRKFETFF